MYKVNEVSKLTGISVRTLQHYDNIELLKATKRDDSNYRYYTNEDIKKLYQILLFKELDFSLKEIKQILDDKEFDKEKALQVQKELVIQKRNRLNNIINSIDEMIDDDKGDEVMSKKNFKAFDYKEIENHKEKYKDEVNKKYRNSDAYKESEEKTSKYSKNDWERITNEANSIYIKLAELMDRDVNDTEVQSVVHEWREHITKNFYNCTIDIFRGLALMYVGDERFTKNIDKYGEGLAQFLSDAMNVYCDNNR